MVEPKLALRSAPPRANPLTLSTEAISEIFFMDIGVAWDKDFPDFNNSEYWGNELGENSEGWSWTYGFGPRFVFLGMPWQLDYTWQYFPLTGENQYNGWYLSVGFDF